MNILGLMSGTSLDGLDMALCEFIDDGEKIRYKLLAAETFEYSDRTRERISGAFMESGSYLAKLNSDLGIYFGEKAREFINRTNIRVDYISSHGQTIFHKPSERSTLQIASPAHIAAMSGIPVVADFRSGDVARGGQGAPLVPIGDKLLFSEFEACLNLGGFSNVSIKSNFGIKAFDIGVCNMLLNSIAEKVGQSYDDGGKIASTGHINQSLLKHWNDGVTSSLSEARSLGREDFEAIYAQDIKNSDLEVSDLMATAIEHVSIIIGDLLNTYHLNEVLVTGGGAFNNSLVKSIESKFQGSLHIPDSRIVSFKEAIIFALLGYLRVNNKVNVLSSVTGASEDHVSGGIWL